MDWETRYQTGDMPWEKGTSAPPLVDWLTRNKIHGRILVPGCGSGHDVRELARAGAQPLGLDLSPSAIALAESYPRSGLESYQPADFFALPPDLIESFDWLYEHTCFCAINPADREKYVDAAATALKPRGELLAIFYLDPGHDHPDDGPPYGATREELDALFGSRFEMLDEYVPTVAYPGREGRELVRRLRKLR
jgi:SAM-dependent methyltransferase